LIGNPKYSGTPVIPRWSGQF